MADPWATRIQGPDNQATANPVPVAVTAGGEGGSNYQAGTANYSSGTNADVTITYAAAGQGDAHALEGLGWSYSAPPTAGGLKVQDGSGVVVFQVDITATGHGYLPLQVRGSSNTALIVTLLAGGSGVVGRLDVIGHRAVSSTGGGHVADPGTGQFDFGNVGQSGLVAAL